MSLELKKALAVKFIRELPTPDPSILADNFTASSPLTDVSREKPTETSKETFLEICPKFSALFKPEHPCTLHVTDVTAEGDRVAVEAYSTGVFTNGNVYRNNYHFLVEVRGDKIVRLREYLDTKHVTESMPKFEV